MNHLKCFGLLEAKTRLTLSNKLVRRHGIGAFAFATATLAALSCPTIPLRAGNGMASNTQTDEEEKASQASAVPNNVTDLKGEVIDYQNRDKFLSIGNPSDESSWNKMFLFYNVGTGKFLNVGSYWGTHAMLSDVPKPFWLQCRNDTIISGQTAYQRYPEKDTSTGNFQYDFNKIKKYQIGSTEGTETYNRSNAIYKSIAIKDLSNNSVYKTLKEETESNANKSFKFIEGTDFDNLDFSKQYVEAYIDLSPCENKDTKDNTGKTTHKFETIFSIGENIDKWQDGNTAIVDVHMYGSVNLDGEHELRVQCVNSAYENDNQKTTINITKTSDNNSNIAHVIIKKNSITVNGVECMPHNYSNPIKQFLQQSSIQVGSAEGAVRSNATYNYVKLFTSRDKQTTADTCVVKSGFYNAQAGNDDALKFSKTYNVNLTTHSVFADIDLSTCTGTNENVLSIGTDIDHWRRPDDKADEKAHNIHFYYTKEGKLELYFVRKEGQSNAVEINQNGDYANHLQVELTSAGLTVNGTTIADQQDVISYLTKTATSLQVGSTQGDNRSHAIYKMLKVVKTSLSSFPEAGDKWNGSKFKKEFKFDQATQEFNATFDVSTCTGTNENILSLGTEGLDNWTTKSDYLIHMYYNAGTLQLDAIHTNDNGKEDKTEIKINLTDDEKKNLNIKFCKYGFFVNGVQKLTTNNNIVKYLLNQSSLWVGSEQGDNRSHATYKKISIDELKAEFDSSPYPTMGTQWTGDKFDKTVYGNLSDHVVEAEIDLSTCTSGNNENVLSIGNAIANWGTGANEHNIHMYYNGSQLSIEGVNSKHTGNDKQPTIKATIKASDIPNKTVKVKLDKNGLYINNAAVSNFGSDNEMVAYLSSSNTVQIQVGSREGNTRSHATYNNITVSKTSNSTTTASAKATNAVAIASTEAEESTEATSTTLDTYIPIYNQKGDGKTALKSDLFNIDWENGDYVEADIDVSTCQYSNENVLSIGNNIGIWGYKAEYDTDNLHIYYAGKENGVYKMKVYYVNKAHNLDNIRNFTITPATDGSAKMLVKVSKDGLFINDTEIYTDTDPMPIIPYEEDLKGTIVKFKYDGDAPALDSYGQYIIVKQGEEGYSEAKGIKCDFSGYIYTEDDAAKNDQPVFITSLFQQEVTSSKNEGKYFAWSPYLTNNNKWGTIGIFGDRNLPQKELGADLSARCAQWHFKKIADDSKNTYQIYLDMDETKVPYRTGTAGGYDFKTAKGQFYLQACEESVLGNSLENYGGGYGDAKAASNSNGVDALTTLPTGEDINKSYWRLIDVTEYYQLFKSANSEMSNMLNLSYSLRDPDFMRENKDLSKWTGTDVFDIKKENNLGSNNKLNIGFDQYSKKSLTDTDYTDEDGNKYTNLGATDGNSTYQFARNHVNNHGRYMGVEVKNGGYGTLSQTAKVYNPGWYAISCGGVSNAGAYLFAKYTLNGTEHTIKQDLHPLTDTEKKFFNATNHTWPYDQAGQNLPLPMYNALVAMNDAQAPDVYHPADATKNGAMVDMLKSQVAFYVDASALPADKSGLDVTLGVTVPEGSSVSEADQWTVFDNFHLLFGGDSKDPNIVFSEDFTNLDYFNNSIHNFKNRPMRLYRTFSANNWNTFVLPVALKKKQFEELLGTDAELLKVKKIDGNKLVFVKETMNESDSIFLRANKPYLVKVHSSQGQQAAYDAYIYNYKDGGKTYDKVSLPDNHYVCYDVSLPTTQENTSTAEGYYVGYSTQEAFYTTINGTKYHYVVKDPDTATDENNTNRSVTFYGTLCKTYEQVDGKNTIINNNTADDVRPDLADGKSYFMKSDNNFYLRKNGAQYGQKGFRCWFVYNEDATPTEAKYIFDIDGVEDDVTGIDDIVTDEADKTINRYAQGIYNMNGQKVAQEAGELNQLPAGIYIVNGRKIIVNK